MKYLRKINENNVNISSEFSSMEYIEYTENFTLIDLINFISKCIPGIVTNKIFKKINENEDNNMEDNKDVIRKFIKYVNEELPEWNDTCEAMYELEEDWDEYIINCEFGDDNIYQFVLFENLKIELDDNEYDELALTIDDNIDYFISEYYIDTNASERTFHVYQNGKFRISSDEEDSYLRAYDDQNELGNQDNILS